MIYFIYNIFGSKRCGIINPPLDDGRKVMLNKELLATFGNDAFEIWIGTSDEWCFHLERKSLHRLIRWYLFQFIILDQCGLRRAIWYWSLRKKCERFKNAGRK